MDEAQDMILYLKKNEMEKIYRVLDLEAEHSENQGWSSKIDFRSKKWDRKDISGVRSRGRVI